MAIKSETTPILLINQTDHELTLPSKYSPTELKKDDIASSGPGAPGTAEEAKQESRSKSKLNLKIPTQKPESKSIYMNLIIEAHSAVRTNKKHLEIYDYEPFLKQGKLSIIEEQVPENVNREYTITNKTAHKIGIPAFDNTQSELVIPAFGSRQISLSAYYKHHFQPWKDLNFIDIISEEKQPEEKQKTQWVFLTVWVAYGWLVILFLKWMNLEKFFGETNSIFSFSIWLLWPIGAIIIALIYLTRNIVQKEGFKRGISRFKKASAALKKNLNELANMTILVLWPVIVPIAVILFFGGILEWINEMIYNGTINFQAFNEGVLYRLLQLLFIIILSTLPGMLYYQYERRKIESIRSQFLRNIMYLNPLLHTTDDAETKYGNLVNEITLTAGFGSKKFSILRSGRPLLLSTALITLCWIYTFWPVGEISQISFTYQMIFSKVSQMNLVNFAFLGAYFFAINLLFKRYSRGDLSPKAYSHISIRIISAIILVSIIGIALGGTQGLNTGTETQNNENVTSVFLYIMAFGIGLVPETGITWMKQILESRTLRRIFPNFRAKHPITDLGGVSLYDKARLTEEGVESVETLAHHNMIELMLRSGIPVARIVDLVDQAILYLHTVDIVCNETNPVNGSNKKKKGLEVLRNEGIRTATDLLAAEKAVTENQNSTDAEIRKRYNPTIFYTLLDSGSNKTYKMQRVLDTLKDDEWLVYVQNWRDTGLCADKLITNPKEILEKEMVLQNAEKTKKRKQ